MAFVVEDGTGLATATSFTTVDHYHQYWTDRGQATSTKGGNANAADVQVWLILASDYIARRWPSENLKARPKTDTQALPFPRDGLKTPRGAALTDVPEDVKIATILYARKIADLPSMDLMPDPVTDPTGLQLTSAEIDTLSVAFSDRKSAGSTRAYPAPDRIMKKYKRSLGVYR